MQARHLSTALLTLGLVVGVAAGVGLVVGFEPARLPAALLNIAAYKLTVLAACGLIASGAIVGRLARRGELHREAGLARHPTDSMLRAAERPESEVQSRVSREAELR
jgi:hypothetical protein